jgi:hypothetical protein
MTIYYSTETAPAGLTPPVRVSDVGQRGRVKTLKNSITLASQVFGSNYIYLGNLPQGSRFRKITMTTDTSLGSSTIGIGTVAGSYIDYKTAAVFTTTETPTEYGLTAKRNAAALTADLALYAIIGVANLPASGNLSIDVEYVES